MVVWFAHVRVGHRQLPIPKSPLTLVRGIFCIVVFQEILYRVLSETENAETQPL